MLNKSVVRELKERIQEANEMWDFCAKKLSHYQNRLEKTADMIKVLEDALATYEENNK